MRILIAEDSATSRLLMRRAVETWGYEVVEVIDGAAAWDVLKGDDAPRLVILDWIMPGIDGVDVCRLVRRRQSQEPPYIIVVTAMDEKQNVVAGLGAGTDDFVTKPFDPAELRARLEVGRRFVELNRKLVETQRLLEIQASTDVLTGALNRRAVIARLEEELARARRGSASLSVGMLDIDHFKRVNDRCGHAVGDAVLREVVRCAASVLRPYDVLGRFGGEEFFVVMPATSALEAAGVLKRMCAAVAAAAIIADGRPLKVKMSLGGATWAGEAIDKLIARADDALYVAKDQGRNRVVMADAESCDAAAVVLEHAV